MTSVLFSHLWEDTLTDFAFLMGPWALSLGLSLSHMTHQLPRVNIKNNIVLQGLDFHRILPLVGGLMKLGL
jgi:hypothetical protein